MACPVCGSVEHPKLAVLSGGAPSEAQVNAATAAAERARSTAQAASQEASRQKGTVVTMEQALTRELQQLLPETALADAAAAANGQMKTLAEEIREIDRAV